jgi:hypothetical protein
MKEIFITPKMFISPPYIKCPKCGKNSFGILMICNHHYNRRCAECFYPEGHEPAMRYPLPKLSKKVIYLDQLVISNMMYALNPKSRAFQAGRVDPFWKQLFERLYRLSRMQLIICPDSCFHIDESLASAYYQDLKRMYELLSFGISFTDSRAIRRFQISKHFKNWIAGKGDEEPKLSRSSVLHGDPNIWQGKYIISMNPNYGDDYIETLRKSRNKICEAWKTISERWKTEKNRKFEEWFIEEVNGIGEGIIELNIQSAFKTQSILSGKTPLTEQNVMSVIPGFAEVLFMK